MTSQNNPPMTSPLNVLPASNPCPAYTHSGAGAALPSAPVIITTDLKELSVKLEHYATPQWAIDAILQKEVLTEMVIDPCAGTGVLTLAARKAGYTCLAYDIHDWGNIPMTILDWLDPPDDAFLPDLVRNNTVLMNPPFSKAEEFVRQALKLGARKIVCFQRFSWLESQRRKNFWDEFPPSRVYLCGDRATCWRHDLLDAGGDGMSNGTTTAHAWFVWERGQIGTVIHRIYKGE